MLARTVYTIVREEPCQSEDSFALDCEAIQDESGEFVYAGPVPGERISVHFEIFKDGNWVRFYPRLSPRTGIPPSR